MTHIQRYAFWQLQQMAVDMRSREWLQARDVDHVLEQDAERIEDLLRIVAQQEEELQRLRVVENQRDE